MSGTRMIPIALLDEHPDNPRIIVREDVVNAIAAQIEERGDYDPAHALLVRPLNGRFQIVQGHHRLYAGQQAGLEELPCWVREMTDEEAYMQLALGNVQGELSPLEIGIHALGVELGTPGRGKKGGISDYARQLGKDVSRISRSRAGAAVLKSINVATSQYFIDKADHLAAIHKANQILWPMLAEWLITPNEKDNEPSVSATDKLVKTIAKYEIPEEWAEILPLTEIVRSFINTGWPLPEGVAEIIPLLRTTYAMIETHAATLGPERFPYTTGGYLKWLRGGIGTYAWDAAKLRTYRQAVLDAATAAAKPPEPNAQDGEWYVLGKHRLYCGDTGKDAFWKDLPYCPFAFADPPYNAEVDDWDKDFEWHHDWLIEKAPIVAVTPGIASMQAFFKADTKMHYRWSMACHITNGRARGALGFGNWIWVAIFSEAESIDRKIQDSFAVSLDPTEGATAREPTTQHRGRKPSAFMRQLIDVFTNPDDCVIDPFLGSGTTLFEADALGRICVGGEISAEFCNDIIRRWQKRTGQAARKLDAGTNEI